MVTNVGHSDLHLSSLSLSASTGFTITSPLGQTTLAPNGSTTFQITFQPSSTGLKSTLVLVGSDDFTIPVLDFTINGTGSATDLDVSFTGTSIPSGSTNSAAAQFDSASVDNGSSGKIFTLKNSGATAVIASSITVSGTNASDYTVAFTPTSLNPGASLNFTVTFDPSAAGERVANITINNNDPNENPYTFTVRGTGTAPLSVVLGNNQTITSGGTPSLGNFTQFGTVALTCATVTRTFTIRNDGTEALNLSGFQLSGTNSGNFSFTQPGSTSLAPAASTTFTVTFDPSSGGARTATVRFLAGSAIFDLNIQGTGDGPDVTVHGKGVAIANNAATTSTSNDTDFGSVSSASGSVIKTFTITNAGTQPLTLGTVTVTGAFTDGFSILTQPPASVAAGASTTFQVILDPFYTGGRNAKITIPNGDNEMSNFNFTVFGQGLGPAISIKGATSGDPFINYGDASPTVVRRTDYGSVAVTSGTSTQSYIIQNSGAETLTLGSVSFAGATAGEFTVTTAPAASVAAGQSTTMQITFDPSDGGLGKVIVHIPTNDPNAGFDQIFTIQGIGTGPEVAVTGNSVAIANNASTPSAADNTDFGSISAASGTVVHTFTVSNPGTAQLTLGSVTKSGSNPGDFTVTGPAATVAAGGTTTIQVTFDPAGIGARTATLSFTTNDNNEAPFTFSIAGTGLSGLQTWRQTYFSTMENTGTAADDYDYEPDGQANLIEFALNGDPKVPGAQAYPTLTEDAQGRLVITFIRRKAATFPGITYSVETGSSPGSLNALSLAGALISSIDSTWEQVSVTDPTITPDRYGHLRVTDP